MSKQPAKDFGPIAEDYAFFETHTTEAAEDARAYLERLRDVVPATGPVRMLDFGCGSGNFTERFLTLADWSPQRLELTLVEPVDMWRRSAVERLGKWTAKPIENTATLPSDAVDGFDVILANHCLYYVTDLRGQLERLIAVLATSGVFVAAIAAMSNALMEVWTVGFGLLGVEIPYYSSEDVETALKELDAEYDKQPVAYELTFPDTEENRLRILRFLLADHLARMPQQPPLDVFDRYRRGGQIEIATGSDHYAIRAVK
jgi:trans-aconitate 2-methyltransferase